EEEVGSEAIREVERRVVLQVMDRKWREHLYEMDYLQEGIGLRAMAQRNPLIEYQREGYDMFQEMLEAIKEDSVRYLFNVEVQVKQKTGVSAASAAAAASANGAAVAAATATEEEAAEAEESAEAEEASEEEVVVPGLEGPSSPGRLQYSAPSEDGGVTKRTETVSDSYEGTPRNAPCPCGSGKKFKKCHGDPKNK